jgi:hypothetical protein
VAHVHSHPHPHSNLDTKIDEGQQVFSDTDYRTYCYKKIYGYLVAAHLMEISSKRARFLKCFLHQDQCPEDPKAPCREFYETAATIPLTDIPCKYEGVHGTLNIEQGVLMKFSPSKYDYANNSVVAKIDNLRKNIRNEQDEQEHKHELDTYKRHLFKNFVEITPIVPIALQSMDDQNIKIKWAKIDYPYL